MNLKIDKYEKKEGTGNYFLKKYWLQISQIWRITNCIDPRSLVNCQQDKHKVNHSQTHHSKTSENKR